MSKQQEAGRKRLGNFKIEPGELILVPINVLFQKQNFKHRGPFAETPIVARAEMMSDGLFRLIRRGEVIDREKKTKVLFLPADAAGKVVEVKDVYPKCASTRVFAGYS